MPKKRRLSDLYRRGQLATFDDGEGPIEVWLQKPSRTEMESVLRRSNAAKARYLLRGEDHESEEYQSALAAVMDIDDLDLLLSLALAEELGKARARIEAQIEFDEKGEWAKEGKLQALYDAWTGDPENPGLRETYALDPEGETPEGVEAKRVLDELTRFQQEIDAAARDEQDALFDQWRDQPRQKINEKAAETFIKNEASDVSIDEFQRQQIFFSVRDPENKDKRYFGTVDEVNALDDEVILPALRLIVMTFMTEVGEGKGSAATTDSSPSSEKREAEEPSQPSGQEASAA